MKKLGVSYIVFFCFVCTRSAAAMQTPKDRLLDRYGKRRYIRLGSDGTRGAKNRLCHIDCKQNHLKHYAYR